MIVRIKREAPYAWLADNHLVDSRNITFATITTIISGSIVSSGSVEMKHHSNRKLFPHSL
jgi:hypothetical protein